MPKTIKKRSLNQKERLIYAPLTGHGGMLYDKDAVYLDTEVRQDEEREGDNLLEEMKNPELAEQEENIGLTLSRGGEAIERRVVPEKIENEVDEDEEMDEDDESDEELEGPEDVASASEDEEEMEIDVQDEKEYSSMISKPCMVYFYLKFNTFKIHTDTIIFPKPCPNLTNKIPCTLHTLSYH